VLALKTEFALKIFKPGGSAALPDPPPCTPMIIYEPSTFKIYQDFPNWVYIYTSWQHCTETALAFFTFHRVFLLTDHKNLQHDHCSSICNALMMITGVIETFVLCR